MSALCLVKCQTCDESELAKHLLKTQTPIFYLLMWRSCLPFTQTHAKRAFVLMTGSEHKVRTVTASQRCHAQ